MATFRPVESRVGPAGFIPAPGDCAFRAAAFATHLIIDVKPIKVSVAVVVRRTGASDFLIVRRPPDDDRLPDLWGLPAVSLRPGELPEEAVRRVGTEKLSIELEPTRFVGARSADRGDYELILMDIEAEIVAGAPDVRQARTMATSYVDQRWTDRIDPLREAADRGSLCCQIMIDAASADSATPI